jgi:uncharacterized protein (DUF362 family)
MRRRDFIKTGAAAVAAGLLPFRFSFADTPKSVVWEVIGSPDAALKALFARLGGLESLVESDAAKASVLIKPNLCLPHPSKMATTTSPEAVGALCGVLEDAGVKRIIIADHTLQSTKRFEKTEIVRMVEKRSGVKLIFANERRYFEPREVEGKVLKHTEVLKILGTADLVINFATAKHHSATGVSLALKNLMGTIWDRVVFHTKLDLDQAIGDLALAVRPHLNLIDAGRVLLNGGPTGPGPIAQENRIFASKDIVALDSVVTSRYNFGGKPLRADGIAHLVAAHHNGLGEIDPEKIHIEKIET